MPTAYTSPLIEELEIKIADATRREIIAQRDWREAYDRFLAIAKRLPPMKVSKQSSAALAESDRLKAVFMDIFGERLDLTEQRNALLVK